MPMIDAATEQRLRAHLRDLRTFIRTPSHQERDRDGYLADPWRTTLTAVDRDASALLDTIAELRRAEAETTGIHKRLYAALLKAERERNEAIAKLDAYRYPLSGGR